MKVGHYNYFRDYEPSIGRYVESDPVGLSGGLNSYQYAQGNPILLVDQWGLKASGGSGGTTDNSRPNPCILDQTSSCKVLWERCEVRPCGSTSPNKSLPGAMVRNYRERCQRILTCLPFFEDVDTGPCPWAPSTSNPWRGTPNRMR
ncbi:MAG: RHS repeat-associated core domain-containing protein [Betaproteobacteria bacterium]|nr:RHS repeat-associated core domain-containing protein [Betaproteobacteria bacterium]